MVQITTTLGVPTVFAGILLYFVLFRLDTALKVIERGEEDRVKLVAAMQDSLIAALDRQTKAFDESIQDNIRANREMISRYEVVPRQPAAPR